MTARCVQPAARLRGVIRVPGDKSISHRALILNALAENEATVHNFLPGEDCLATLSCLKALGVKIREEAAPRPQALSLKIRGSARLQEAGAVLDAGNSGTTMRLLAGLLAGQPIFSVLSGDESLRRRPMGRVVEPLRAMGARISGRASGSLAPLAIEGGALKGRHHQLPVASAQVKSALLLAGLQAEGTTEVTEPVRSRNHTELMLREMGANLAVDGTTVTVQGGVALRAASFSVPGDFSSAAYWLVAGCIHPDAEMTLLDVGINPTRTGLLTVLEAMGADLHVTNRRSAGGEPVADLIVRSSRLRAIAVPPELVPSMIDELPLFALAAAVAEGSSVVHGAAELRVKESDRISAIATQLTALGAVISEAPDGFTVDGGRALRGGRVDSLGDHRLAMTMAIAGLGATEPVEVNGWQSAAVSYPGFWDELERVAG